LDISYITLVMYNAKRMRLIAQPRCLWRH